MSQGFQGVYNPRIFSKTSWKPIHVIIWLFINNNSQCMPHSLVNISLEVCSLTYYNIANESVDPIVFPYFYQNMHVLVNVEIPQVSTIIGDINTQVIIVRQNAKQNV